MIGECFWKRNVFWARFSERKCELSGGTEIRTLDAIMLIIISINKQ